jgi:P pilus assembly protein, pilin FimA
MNRDPIALRIAKWGSTACLAIGLLIASRSASAQAAPACTASPSSASISLSPVSITPGMSNGKIGQASNVRVTFDCNTAFWQTPNDEDDFTLLTGNLASFDSATIPPGGSGIMFTTNVPGIEVWLTAKPNQASSGNNGPNGASGWAMGNIDCIYHNNNNWSCTPGNVYATFTAQLVKTGPVAAGTVSSINLLQFFDSDTYRPTLQSGSLQYSPSPAFGTLILNPVTVSMTACTVTSQSANLTVTLPPVLSSALGSAGATAGQTPFNIYYSCPSGWSLYMTLSTTSPGSVPGVIMPSGSCSSGSPAANVGVQLLQGGNQQPVNFDVAQSLGNSPNGMFTVPYYARYYAAGTAGAGPVCATATFTMTYQ